MTDKDDITTLFALGLGPWLTPLRGKIPVLDAWQALPPVREEQVREWVEIGYNLGFRTGAKSGLVVIDDDQPREGGGDYTPPPTGLVSVSPTGGRHYYYRAPDPCPRNSASQLAPHVDVRGEGGQVVVPPSIHPTARTAYRWESTGEPAPYPVAPRVDMTHPTPPRGTGYAQTALVQEAARVRAAPEGTRNDALNRAAFSLGQLVAGGALTDAEVRAELTAAASIAGLDDRETEKTIRSGLQSGADSPRTVPERTTTATATRTVPATKPEVLVPGSHVMPTGEYREQGTHDMAEQVLKALPAGTIYRRAGTIGEVVAGEFAACTHNRLRPIVDRAVRLVAGKPPKGDEDDPALVYRPCTRDIAAVLADYGAVQGEVRDLRHIAKHPVCIGQDFDFAAPGWNHDGGVYLADAEAFEPLPLAEARAVLEDLVVDFPFQTPADRANFFGLLLTPILRPAINEPSPMHLVLSPIERTGKSKLVEVVLGVSITGRKVAAFPLPEREEERAKAILAVLLRGQTIWHLDNLTEHLGSATLASLLTSTDYQARQLGSSIAPIVPNGLTIIGSGNNVHGTGEITKRIVPIRLMPDTDSPEARTDFRHPDLLGFVTDVRPRVIGALMGMIDAWKAAGRPLHKAPFGGFERWAAVVGGILATAGYDEWLTTMKDWRGTADDTGGEDAALVGAWHAQHGNAQVEAASIYQLATDLDIYGWLDSRKTDRARRTAFGMRVLNRLVGRVMPVGGLMVRVSSEGVGARRRVWLADL